MKRYDEVLLERGTDHVVRWTRLEDVDIEVGRVYLVWHPIWGVNTYHLSLAYKNEAGEWLGHNSGGRVIKPPVEVLEIPELMGYVT